MPDLSTTRTVDNTPAEHVSDHNDAHGKINTLYNVHTTGQRLWVPAAAFSLVEGTPAATVFGSPRFSGWALDAAVDEAVGAMVGFPEDWTSYSAQVYSVSTGAGIARVDLQRFTLTAAANLATAAFTSDIIDLSHTANLLAVSAHAGGAIDGPTYFRVHRDANHANDTLAADAIFLGVVFNKAS